MKYIKKYEGLRTGGAELYQDNLKKNYDLIYQDVMDILTDLSDIGFHCSLHIKYNSIRIEIYNHWKNIYLGDLPDKDIHHNWLDIKETLLHLEDYLSTKNFKLLYLKYGDWFTLNGLISSGYLSDQLIIKLVD